MDPTTPNIATTIAELARQASATKSLGSDIVALPTAKGDFQLHNLEIYQPHPTDIRQIVKIATLADHVDYVIRQRAAGSNTVLFANRKALKFTTIMAYHGAELGEWLRHRVHTALERSQQLTTWLTVAGQWMTQEAFGEFLDINLSDITTPAPATVLDFVEQLECSRKEYFRSAKNQTTGEVQYAWGKENDAAATSQAKIVKEFTLGIPIWHRGEAVQVKARLQHNIKEQDGKASVQFRFKVEHIDRIEDKLWEEKLTELKEKLKGHATVYEGEEPGEPGLVTGRL